MPLSLEFVVATTVPSSVVTVTVAPEMGSPSVSRTRPLMTDEPGAPCAGVKMPVTIRVTEV